MKNGIDEAISIRELRVDYGDFVAVRDISMSIPWGEVYGLVGPNGAGKTSTFQVLATLMEPTYGEVTVAGYDVLEQTSGARRVMGYMPDLAPVPSDLKAWEFLDFHADTHALGGRRDRRKRVDECLEIAGLREKRNAWCRALSRGQTQRLVLAKTLLHRPQVLILDEPASGLDPLARRELRLALQRLAADGATVIVSSHILSELAEMCSLLCVMSDGQLLASGTVEDVRRELGRSERQITVTPVNGAGKVREWLDDRGGVGAVREVESKVHFSFQGSDEEQAELMAAMMASGVRIKAFEESGSSFEEILIDVAERSRGQ
ncbi:MAG: ABC transporter ATP-binding protein [Verrucomicrobiota bacterium]